MIFIGVGSPDGPVVQRAVCLSDASLEEQQQPRQISHVLQGLMLLMEMGDGTACF